MESATRLEFTTRRFTAQPPAAANTRYQGVPVNDHDEEYELRPHDRRHVSAPEPHQYNATPQSMAPTVYDNNGVRTYAFTPLQPAGPRPAPGPAPAPAPNAPASVTTSQHSRNSSQQSAGKPPPPPYKSSQQPWRIALCAVLWSLFVVAWIVTPIVILYAYLFYWHNTVLVGNTLQTGADPTNLLGIIGIITKATEQCTVIVMALMATSAAAQWWRASRSRHQDERPTGVQLGVAMEVMTSANVWAAFNSLAFLFNFKKAAPHRKIKMPSYMSGAIVVLAWLLFLHFIMAGLDYALHFTTHPAPVIEQTLRSINTTGLWHDLNLNLSTVIPHTDTVKGIRLPYGRPFNLTRCEEYRRQNNIVPGSSSDNCNLRNGSNNEMYIATPDALRTMSNSSDSNAVAWTSDGTAIVVPARTAANVSYTARALGARSQCKSITNQCVKCAYKPEYNTTLCSSPGSSEAYLSFQCPNLNTTGMNGYYPEGIIDPNTNAVYQYPGTGAPFASQFAQANPFRFAFVAQTFAYANMKNATNGSGGMVGDTGFIIWGHDGGLNVIDCDITILETEYKFEPPNKYTILNATLAPVNMTSFVSVNPPSAQRITEQVEGAGTTDGSMSFADAAALQLSRQYMSWSSILIDSEPTTDVLGFHVQGALVSMIVLAVYLGLATLYLLTAVCVGLIACINALRGRTPAQSLAYARLLKPYAALADAYGSRTTDFKHSLTRNGFRTFNPQHDADRLDIEQVFDAQHPSRPDKGVWRVNVRRAGDRVPHGHAEQYREQCSSCGRCSGES